MPGRVAYTCRQYYYIGFYYELKTGSIWRSIADILKIRVKIVGIFQEQKCTLLPGPSGKTVCGTRREPPVFLYFTPEEKNDHPVP